MNGRRRLAWLPPDAPAPPPSIGARHDPCQHPGRSCGQGIRNGEPTSPGQANQATPFLGLRKRRRPEALGRQPQSGAPFHKEPSAGAGLHVVPCVQAGPRGLNQGSPPWHGAAAGRAGHRQWGPPENRAGLRERTSPSGAGAGPGEWRGGRGASGDAAAWRSAPPRIRGSSPRPRQAPDERGSCHHAPRNGIAGNGSDAGASSCPGGNTRVSRAFPEARGAPQARRLPGNRTGRPSRPIRPPAPPVQSAGGARTARIVPRRPWPGARPVCEVRARTSPYGKQGKSFQAPGVAPCRWSLDIVNGASLGRRARPRSVGIPTPALGEGRARRSFLDFIPGVEYFLVEIFRAARRCSRLVLSYGALGRSVAPLLIGTRPRTRTRTRSIRVRNYN